MMMIIQLIFNFNMINTENDFLNFFLINKRIKKQFEILFNIELI